MRSITSRTTRASSTSRASGARRLIAALAAIVGAALIVALIVALAPAPASAQSSKDKGKGKGTRAGGDTAGETQSGEAGTGGEAGGDKDEAPKVRVERGHGGRKVYRITQGFVIEGRIQKPNAFYVLQRSPINYDWADLKQQFVPRITEAVRKSPF